MSELRRQITGGGVSLRRGLWSLWVVNRFEALLAYNVGYMLLLGAAGLAAGATVDRLWLLGPLFGGVILSKSQASVADAIHDYEADRSNPQKSYVSEAVDVIGERSSRTFLVVQLLGGLLLWGYLTHVTGSLVYLLAGVGISFFGYTYSYPPRFKEWNVFNHVVTSGVDVTCILLPGLLLVTGAPASAHLGVFAIVFAYSMAFHVMHQAGDTYYDRRRSISTFTTTVGVGAAVAFSAGSLLLAAAIAALVGFPVIAVATAAYGGYFLWLYRRVRGEPEQSQSDVVSASFSVARCATLLNLSLTADFALVAASYL